LNREALFDFVHLGELRVSRLLEPVAILITIHGGRHRTDIKTGARECGDASRLLK
jgi:hypothetical protein